MKNYRRNSWLFAGALFTCDWVLFHPPPLPTVDVNPRSKYYQFFLKGARFLVWHRGCWRTCFVDVVPFLREQGAQGAFRVLRLIGRALSRRRRWYSGCAFLLETNSFKLTSVNSALPQKAENIISQIIGCDAICNIISWEIFKHAEDKRYIPYLAKYPYDLCWSLRYTDREGWP
ncbi:hypothetical protein B0O99DRAFT_611949 [Bisporella sp. PMI_857]|nr:hypothetical protein B0O99DRAFT_611949 [Bisporella sp. PMI_857]